VLNHATNHTHQRWQTFEMNRKTTILFIGLELFSGIGFGIFGTILVTPSKPIFDLNLSIIILFLTFCVFAFIGIGIPAYFHSRMNDKTKKYGIAMGKVALGILIGLIFGGILNELTSDFLHNRVNDFVLFFTPILFGVIGFNIGMKSRMELKVNEK
jgi:MFS family permease